MTDGDTLLKIKDVQKIVPFGRSTIWKKVKNNDFPSPIKLGYRTALWLKSDVDNYVANLAIEKNRKGGMVNA